MKTILPVLLTFFLSLILSHSFAQKLDESYLPQIKGEIYPRNMVKQEDGKFLVLGDNLEFVDSIPVSQIIRLNSDGSLDKSFNPPKFEQNLNKVIVTKNGKIIISYYGREIFTLNSDGSLDKEFEFENLSKFTTIRRLWAIDSTFFVLYSHPELNVNVLDKFHENGEKVESFTPIQFDNQFGGTITHLEELDNGQLVSAGEFKRVNGIEQNNLVLINPDGTIDPTLKTGSGFGSGSNNLKFRIQQEKILAFGNISTYNGAKFPEGIVRINLDGTIDDDFVSGIISSSFSHPPYGLMVDNNNDLFILGSVNHGIKTTFDLLKFTSEGLIDYSFNKVSLELTGYWEADILQNDKNQLFIYGKFHTIQTNPIYNLVKFNLSENTLDNYDLKLRGNGLVKKALKLKNGKTVVIGEFTDIGNTTQSKFAVLDKNGLVDNNFNLNHSFKPDDKVSCVKELDNGNILIGGSFQTEDIYKTNILLKIDTFGFVDHTFDIYSDYKFSYVEELELLKNGDIIIVGNFSRVNEMEISKIAKIVNGGTIDTSFKPNNDLKLNWVPHFIKTLNENKILLAGTKSNNNLPSSCEIILLDSSGVRDPSFIGLSNQNTYIRTLTKISEDKIIYGGSSGWASSFETRTPLFQFNFKTDFNDSLSIKSLYRYNFPIFNDILVLDSSNLIIGGIFDAINGYDNQGLAKVKPNGKVDRYFNFNVEGEVFSIVRDDDEHILVFGNFKKIQGNKTYSGARIKISNFIPQLKEELQIKVAEDSTISFTPSSLGIIDEDDPLEDIFIIFQSGANYSVENNKVIPKENFNGELKVPVKVSDQKDTIDLIIPIEILAQNDPPVIQNLVSELSIYQATSIAITKEDFLISDPDNSLEEIDLILLDGENYQVIGDSIVVQKGFNGEITIKVQAIDEESLSEIFEFTIDVQTVIGKNQPPVITKLVSDLTIFETTSIAITKEDFLISDPDNSLEEIDLILLDGENYQVIGDSIVVQKGFNGEITIKVQASDGESLGEIFEFAIDVQTTIAKNIPPLIQSLVSKLNIIETTSIAITKEDFVISDPDNSLEEIDLILLDGENYQVIDDSIVVQKGFNGEITVRAQATDGESLSEIFEFTIDVQTVIGKNQPPVITKLVSDLTIFETTSIAITKEDFVISDPDNIQDEIDLILLDGENYQVIDDSIVVQKGFNGEITVRAQATDGESLSEIFEFTIDVQTVIGKNQPPVITKLVSDLTIFETTSIAITKEDFAISDPDNTQDEIDLILLDGENYQVIGDSIVVEEGFNGEITVRAQATDGESLGEVFEFTIDVQTVIGKNQPPVITKLVSDLTIFETTSIAITKEDFSISDPDNTQDEIDLILLGGENYQVKGDSIVVQNGFNGKISVRAQATDGESLGEVFQFTIDVQTFIGKNEPPQITKLVSDLTIFETTSIAIAKEDFSISDPDNTQDEIDLILLDGENYQVIGDSIVVEEGFNGEITVRAQATDGESLSEIFEFTIDVQTVIGKNQPPVITKLVSDLTIFETTSIAITKEDFIFSDPDNTQDEIDLILLDGENYQVIGDSIVVEEGFNGEITVRAQATDGESLGEVFEFTIEVQTITGLEDEILGKLIIYPNPAKSFLNITNQNNILILGINVVELSGKIHTVVYKKENNGLVLNISHLKPGLYLINILLQNGTVIKKIQIE